MKITILYPADYFDIKKVDTDYRQEYEEAVKSGRLQDRLAVELLITKEY